MSPNIAVSIRARHLNRSRIENVNFQLFLDRYACERFLYRLGQSDARTRFILKGASLLSVWMDEPFRATRDIDLLAFGANDGESVRRVVETICSIPCPEDGLLFDLDSLRVSPIRDSQLYGGQRAGMRAFLGKARATVQVDFGSLLKPPPESFEDIGMRMHEFLGPVRIQHPVGRNFRDDVAGRRALASSRAVCQRLSCTGYV
jgi:hypothetical protein